MVKIQAAALVVLALVLTGVSSQPTPGSCATTGTVGAFIEGAFGCECKALNALRSGDNCVCRDSTLVMAADFSSCGITSDEQTKRLDAIRTKYQALIDSARKRQESVSRLFEPRLGLRNPYSLDYLNYDGERTFLQRERLRDWARLKINEATRRYRDLMDSLQVSSFSRARRALDRELSNIKRRYVQRANDIARIANVNRSIAEDRYLDRRYLGDPYYDYRRASSLNRWRRSSFFDSPLAAFAPRSFYRDRYRYDYLDNCPSTVGLSAADYEVSRITCRMSAELARVMTIPVVTT